MATVGTLLGLGGRLVHTARDSLKQLRVVADRADAARRQVLEGGDVATRAAEVLRAEAEEFVARTKLAELDGAVTQLEQQLDDLEPGRRLYQFIAERAASTEYRGQLGVVSSVRRDGEQLVELMRRWRESPSGQQTPIDRIVLYVDDLDRCEPEQVVQVLQAVHLLLAMDLFVVVVGVDPRWLLQSLRQRYRGILDASPAASDEHPLDPGLVTSPQSYLEKIFQIPFTLPRMTDTSFGRLMNSMADGPKGTRATVDAFSGRDPGVKPEDAVEGGSRGAGPPGAGAGASAPATPTDPGQAVTPAADTGETSPREDAEIPQDPESPEVRDQEVVAPDSGSEVAGGLRAADRRSTASVADIVSTPVTRRERDLLNLMGPLVSSRRAATRLFNLCGLLRSATDLAPGRSFLGRPGQPGAYQAVAQLLGVLTADPELLGVLLYGPPTADDVDRRGLCRTLDPALTWPDVVAGMRPVRDSDDRWANAYAVGLRDDEVERWRRVHLGLHGLLPMVTLHDLEPYRTWGPQIARFSFVLSPQVQVTLTDSDGP